MTPELAAAIIACLGAIATCTLELGSERSLQYKPGPARRMCTAHRVQLHSITVFPRSLRAATMAVSAVLAPTLAFGRTQSTIVVTRTAGTSVQAKAWIRAATSIATSTRFA